MKKIIFILILLALLLTSCAPTKIDPETGQPIIPVNSLTWMYRMVDRQNNIVCYATNMSSSPFCFHLDKIYGESGLIQ